MAPDRLSRAFRRLPWCVVAGSADAVTSVGRLLTNIFVAGQIRASRAMVNANDKG